MEQHCLAQTSVQLIIEKMTNRSGSAMRVTEQDTLRDRGRKKSQSHRDRSCDCECNDFKTYLFLEIRRKEICGVNNCLHLKETVPVITQTGIYCDFFLIITCTFVDHNKDFLRPLFHPNELSDSMHKTFIVCHGLSNIIIFRLRQSKQPMTKQCGENMFQFVLTVSVTWSRSARQHIKLPNEVYSLLFGDLSYCYLCCAFTLTLA